MNNKYIIIYILFLLAVLLFINNEDKYELFSNNNIYDVYVLYVPKREKYIKNIISKLNLNTNINYVQGIDKNDIKPNDLIRENKITKRWYDTRIKPIKYIKSFNKGRTTCHLGHINILNKFLKSNSKYALIFEDDININGNYNEISNKINYIINNIPKDADIVYLSYCFEICSRLKKTDDIFIKAYRPLCRHFYLVTKKGAKVIIDKTLPMYSSGDRMIGELIKKNILNGYIVNPSYLIINQKRNSNTNLETLLDNKQDHRLCL